MRAMPETIENEEAVLACMHIDPQAALYGLELLKPSDFSREIHQDIFAAMKAIRAAGDSRIDFFSVRDAMEAAGTLKEDTIEYFMNITECVPTSANMAYHTQMVLRDSKRRAVIYVCNDVSNFAYSDDHADEDPVAEFMRRGMELGETRNADCSDVGALCHSIFDRLADHVDGKVERGRMWYGLSDLDKICRGVEPGYEYTIIGARPSNGKTALANQLAVSAMRQGRKVLYFSLETSDKKLLERMVFSELGLNSARFWNREYEFGNMEMHSRLAKATGRVRELADSLMLTDVKTTLSQMQNKITRLAHRSKDTDKPLGLVIIDYIQLVLSEGKTRTRNEALELISQGLKNTVKGLDIPLVALAQISRAGADKPSLEHIRDGGNIEADADKVILLDNPPNKDPDRANMPRDCEIVVAKNRDGRTGVAQCAFHGGFLKFTGRSVDEWGGFYDE